MSGTGASLAGVSTRINGRHAFTHERVLELIVRETELRESVTFNKSDLARRLGCCERTLDRAFTRLRHDGLIVSEAAYAPSGAQLGNVYRATPEGIALARTFTREKRKPKAK